MLTLAIDTSTSVLSTALVHKGEVLASINEQTKNNQSEVLMSRIELMMTKCHAKPADLEKIAVAVGPGSYTGIRVGVTAAKSLAYALNIPVVGISSLKVMAHLLLDERFVAENKVDVIVSMIDARRGTVFAGAYDLTGMNVLPDGHYEIHELLERLPTAKAIFYVTDDKLVDQGFVIRREGTFEGSKSEILARLANKASPIKNVHELLPIYLRKTEAELKIGV